MSYKKCAECKLDLPTSKFNGMAKSKDGFSPLCRECRNKRRRGLHQQTKNQEGNRSKAILQNLAERGSPSELARRLSQRESPDGLRRLIMIAGKAGKIDSLTVLAEHAGNDWLPLILAWAVVAPEDQGLELTCMLLNRGVDVNGETQRSESTLTIDAASSGNFKTLELLVEYGAKRDIFTDAAAGNLDEVDDFLRRNPSKVNHSNSAGHSLLHCCAGSYAWKRHKDLKERLVAIARKLLEVGANPDLSTQGMLLRTPLEIAASIGANIGVIEALLDGGAQVKGVTFLFALGHFQRHGRGNYEIADLLLSRSRYNLNAVEGRGLIHIFASHGDVKAVAWLLDHGSDPNLRTSDGETALHVAVSRNDSVKLAELLINRGAEISTTNDIGETPLDLALKNEKVKVAEFLKRN